MDASEFNQFMSLYNELDRVIDTYVRYNYKDYSVNHWKIVGEYVYKVCIYMYGNVYEEDIKIEFVSVNDLLVWSERNGIL